MKPKIMQTFHEPYPRYKFSLMLKKRFKNMKMRYSITTFLLLLCFSVGLAQNYQAEYLVQYDNFRENNDSANFKSGEWVPPVQLKLKYQLLANENFVHVKVRTLDVQSNFKRELTANDSGKAVIVDLKDTLAYWVDKDSVRKIKYYGTTDEQQVQPEGCKSMNLTGDKASYQIKMCDSIPPFITPLVFVAGASGGITSAKSPKQNMKLIDFKITDTKMPDYSTYFKK